MLMWPTFNQVLRASFIKGPVTFCLLLYTFKEKYLLDQVGKKVKVKLKDGSNMKEETRKKLFPK